MGPAIGMDVYVVDLAGKSTLGTHMVFVTGKSPMHMRKMADAFVRAVSGVWRNYWC